MPTRSAFSSGPSTGEPPAERRLDDVVDGLGIADAALDQRNRLAPERMLQPVADEAGHVLLHMRRLLAGVGVQLHGEVDRLPARSIACRSPRPAAPGTADSTNGCRARARGRCRPCMISVIGMTEVLLARMVSGRTCFSISANSFCFSGKSSEHRLDHVVGVAHALGRDRRPARTRSTAVSSSPRSRRLAAMRVLHRVEVRLVRVGDGDVVAGEREHLRDAVAHQAGADDGDARFAAMRQPAV